MRNQFINHMTKSYCRPSILSLQHMSLNSFSMFHNSSLVAHYYSYYLPFFEPLRRFWSRDYLTPYCDPWQPYFRLRLFIHSQDSFQVHLAHQAPLQAHLDTLGPVDTFRLTFCMTCMARIGLTILFNYFVLLYLFLFYFNL